MSDEHVRASDPSESDDTDVTFDMLPDRPAEALEGELLDEALADALVAHLLTQGEVRLLLTDAAAAEAEIADTEPRLEPAIRQAALRAFADSLERDPGQAGIQSARIESARIIATDVPELELLESDLIADVVAARADAATLSPQVRLAALAAFERSVASEALEAGAGESEAGASQYPTAVPTLRSDHRRQVDTTPLRSRRLRPLFAPSAWAAMAAGVLLLIGASFYLGRGEDTAEAGVQLTSLKRIDRAGASRMSQVEPRYFAEVGSVFEPAPDELLAFGLAPKARLIAGAGDALRVTREGGRPHFRLESGEVVLSTEAQPVSLLVDGTGLLELLDGAAHVAIDETGGPVVALPPGSEARFTPRDGPTVSLVGPATGLLSAEGPQAFGSAARSLFEELQFFGGALPRSEQSAPVSARTCHVRSGRVRRARHALEVLAPISGEASGETAAAALAWQPRPWLADATRLRVHLRAPAGTTVRAQRIGPDGAGGVARVGKAGQGPGSTLASEPGLAVLDLDLAPGWYQRLQGGPLVLELEVPLAPRADRASPGESPSNELRTGRPSHVAAWFDGLTLILGAEAPAPEAAEKDPRLE